MPEPQDVPRPWYVDQRVEIGNGYALMFTPLGRTAVGRASEALPDLPPAEALQAAVQVREQILSALATVTLWLRAAEQEQRSRLVAPARGGLVIP